ncbi:MAG: hypothetical protein HN742_33170 [Lentisphaerae bacterium]|jgi:hypothetical protein|nr:hypothetical protein [Lentisphaerota bacterium]MBT4818945.1 hypothetical protein [Lentisphaerota bacterium]MBT5612930.1 hypothetical protein [Lentisphaerota bacterium]MBT7054034.1 hypothetical protein [Lentisphaerota bacterium]MBT7846769.1 hypothetical protein [Lentisphaerota bacterium]
MRPCIHVVLSLFCTGCVLTGRPGENREKWGTYTSRIEDIQVTCRFPAPRGNEPDHSPVVTPALLGEHSPVIGLVGTYLDFDGLVPYNSLPQYEVRVAIIANDVQGMGVPTAAAVQGEWENSIADRPEVLHESHLLSHPEGTVFHIVFFHDKIEGNPVRGETFAFPLAQSYHLVVDADYGRSMSGDPEWLASRRGITEDIYKSIRIQRLPQEPGITPKPLEPRDDGAP